MPDAEWIVRRLVACIPVVRSTSGIWLCSLCEQLRPAQAGALDWHSSDCPWRLAHEHLNTPLVTGRSPPRP